MSFYSIDGAGLLFSQTGPLSVALSAAFPPVQTGRLWANLAGSADYDLEFLPINIMLTARTWIGQTAAGWDTGTAAVRAVLDANGYPTQMPPGVTGISTLLLTAQPASSGTVLNGRYRFTYDGEGTFALTGPGVSNVTVVSPGTIEFDYTAVGADPDLEIRILTINSSNHPRNMKVFQTRWAAQLAAGRMVRPDFEFSDLGVLRFMDLQQTNRHHLLGHSGVGTWAVEGCYTWNEKGIPVEHIAQISNELGISPWVCIPHTADNAYVERFATELRDRLNPALKCYVEWSNECWNFGFQQTNYCVTQAQSTFGGNGTDNAAWFQWAGGRASQCMSIFSTVFAGQMNRIVRVAGLFTSWEGLESAYLDAPLWVALGNPAPGNFFDGYAISGYFYSGIVDEPVLTNLLSVLSTSGTQAAIDFTMDRLYGPESVSGSLAELFGHWDYHRAQCNARGLDLLMYEGGTHILANPADQGNTALVNFLGALNYSPEMGQVYRDVLIQWDTVGDGGFNHYLTIGPHSRFGSWGAMRWPGDVNPRSTVLLEYNDAPLGPVLNPVPLSARVAITGHSIPDYVFEWPWAGVITSAGATPDIIDGTGPYATAQFRWNNDPAGPDQTKAALQAPGATFDLFLGIEAHGGLFGTPARASVQTHITFSDAYGYALLWHNLAATTGAQTFYGNFWRDDPELLFGASWRAAQNEEVPLWNGIIDHVNANRNAGTPTMRLVPWLQVFMAIYDAIQAGTVTGVTMADFFEDNVHPSDLGTWALMATVMAVMYQRHPDQLSNTVPLQFSGNLTIPSTLAAQLRPLVWSTCLNTPRTGLN